MLNFHIIKVVICLFIALLLIACSFSFQFENGYAVNTEGQVAEGFVSDTDAEIEALETIDESTDENNLFNK